MERTPSERTLQVSRRGALGVIGAGVGLAALTGRTAHAEDKPAPAAKPAPSNGNGFYRFKVGDLDVFSMGDGNGAMPAFPTWGENASEEQVAAALAKDFLDPKSAAVSFNVPMVRTSAGVVLFDAGLGFGGRSWGAGRLAQSLANAGVTPDEVAALVVTHLHGDHFGGLTNEDGSLVFPKARYYIQMNEADFWSGPAPDLSGSKADDASKKQMAAGAAAAFAKIKPKCELLDGASEIVPGVRVEPAFGHTPGHQMAHISGGGQELLLITDCIHNHCLSLRHPQWHLRFDADAAKGAATRTRMLDRAASDKALVLAYHMPFPGLGHIRREGEGFEWVPAEWKW